MWWLSFAGRTALVYGLRLGTAAASFASAAALARLLASEHYGKFVFLSTLASLLTQILAFGAVPFMTRGIAQARGAHDTATLADHIRNAGTVVFFAALLTMGGMGLGGLFWGSYRGDSLTAWLAAGLAGTLGLSLSYHSALLAGFERVLPAQLAHAAAPGLTALLAGSVWLSAPPPALIGPELGFIVQIIALMITLGVLLPLSRRTRVANCGTRDFQGWTSMKGLARYMRDGVILGLNQLLVNGFTQIDILMLGVLGSAEDVAVYHVGNRVAYMALVVLGAVHFVTAPSVARYWGGEQREAFDNLLARASLTAFTGCLCLAVVIGAWAAELERLFGSSFDGAKDIMAVLLAGHVAFAFFGLSDTALVMSKFAGLSVAAFLAANVTNVIGNLLMIPRWGASGAAASSAIALVTLGIWLWAACAHKLDSRFDVVSALLILTRKRQRCA